MTALAPFTATSIAAIERFDLVRLIGGNCRPSDGSGELATHHAPRHYASGVSAGIIPLRNSEVYRVILSGGASSDELLFQDTDGKASPSGLGAAIGRSRSSGAVGDEIEFTYESAAAASGDTGGQTESTYTLDRVTIDPDLDTLTAAALLTLVQDEEPEYASVVRLDDYDNIWVIDGDTGRQRLYKTFDGIAKLMQTQQGIVEGIRSYHLITSSDSIHTTRTAGDWYNGSPVQNDILEVQYTPTYRHQRRLFKWVGVWSALDTEEKIIAVSEPHGFDLTEFEGQRVPVAWHFESDVDQVGRAPASIEEVNHFLIRAGNVSPGIDYVMYRTAADVNNRYYDEITNGLGAKSETVYWDQPSNSHTTAANDLRLFQVSNWDAQIIKMDLEDVRAMGNAAGRVPVTAEFNQSATIAAGTIINLNTDTAGFLTLRPGENAYTSHNFGANPTAFSIGYGKDFWICTNGVRIEQLDLMYINSSQVRIDVALQAGLNGELSVHTLI